MCRALACSLLDVHGVGVHIRRLPSSTIRCCTARRGWRCPNEVALEQNWDSHSYKLLGESSITNATPLSAWMLASCSFHSAWLCLHVCRWRSTEGCLRRPPKHMLQHHIPSCSSGRSPLCAGRLANSAPLDATWWGRGQDVAPRCRSHSQRWRDNSIRACAPIYELPFPPEAESS